MQLWFTEKQTNNLAISMQVRQNLHREQSPYQDIAVLDTEEYGRLLVIDGAVMLTDADEFVYHELIAHLPMFTHGNVRRAAVIGGGDGGSIRELLRHSSLEEVYLFELDERVVRVCQEYFPKVSSGLTDPRVRLEFGDGIARIAQFKEYFDLVIVDSTDPVGPGAVLFSQEFYSLVHQALSPGGLVVAQTESPFVNRDIMADSREKLAKVFPQTYVYLGAIPTYPSGLWSFTIGSKGPDPHKVDMDCVAQSIATWPLRYYSAQMHTQALTLPKFVQDIYR
jgi:spermidine synthase